MENPIPPQTKDEYAKEQNVPFLQPLFWGGGTGVI